SLYEDTGALTIAAGLDTPELWPVLKLIRREIKRLTCKPPSLPELRRARDYILGQMTLNLEGSENQMMWAGEQLLSYGKLGSQKNVQQKLLAVTAKDIRRAAEMLFQAGNLRLAIISPDANSTRLEKLLRQF